MKSDEFVSVIAEAFANNNKALLFKGEEELLYLKNFLKTTLAPLSNSNEETSIRTIIDGCSRCRGVVRRKYAFGTGVNRVMIILNSPRLISSEEAQLFKKDSAELLKKMINAIDLKLDECYVTNLIKCESSDLLLKPSDMVSSCLSILKREIEIVKPEIILVMGEIIPLQSLVKSLKGITWFVTDHTISILKNPELKRPAWETLKQMKSKYWQNRR